MGTMMPTEGQRSDRKRRSLAFQFMQLGTMNAVILMMGLAAGWLVDSHFGTIPIFIFVGLLVGIGLCCTVTYRLISQYFKD